MTVGNPQRPTSDSPEQLGFTKSKPVHWLSPSMLLNTAGRVVLSDVFGAYLDKRELQSSLAGPTCTTSARAATTEPSCGSTTSPTSATGSTPTYTIAYLLAQDHLEVDGRTLPRGQFLMMGGDEVYPTPTAQRYEDKTKGPYQAALPDRAGRAGRRISTRCPATTTGTTDSPSFMRLFVKNGKDHIGGWENAQSRSYFAIQLPHSWWLFAIDTQFGAYIDDPQLDTSTRPRRSCSPATG